MDRLPITYAKIDTGAFAHNFMRAKILSDNAEVIPVIKANAYGHGAEQIAKVCIKLGARTAGLARVNEGVKLREAGIKKLSLAILGGFSANEAEAIAKYNLEPSVYSVREAVLLQQAASRMRKKIRIHIKVNTGMNRLGIRPEEAEEFIGFIKTLSSLKVASVYTHLPCSDEKNDNMTPLQLELLRRAALSQKGAFLHASNSAAIAKYGSGGFDAVRPGIMLYGSFTDSGMKQKAKVKPVMSLVATVVHTIKLKKGEGVSYGLTYRAKKDEYIAILSIGYGDGYPRLLSGRGRAIINGKFRSVLGRICMDMLAVSSDKNVKAGDRAIMLGTDGKNTIAAEELAQLSNTISYEIFTGISERVARVYV